jgi:hypothetical protein
MDRFIGSAKMDAFLESEIIEFLLSMRAKFQ